MIYEGPPIDGARVIQVIETNLYLAGSGKDKDPYRRVTQYYSLDGKLLAQVDPHVPQKVTQILSCD